ncbi:MAG: APC family permease, partial [Vicinamibacterales bacterium]
MSASTPAGSATASELARRLGPFDAAAIIVSNVIGGGILFTPPQVAASVPSAPLFLVIWLAGGALAFAGALAYAELAAMTPRAGGEYVYLRRAFGPAAAFLTGWTSFVAGFTGAIATSAVVFAFYLGRFVPWVADGTAWLALPVIPGVLALTLSPKTVTAIALIVALAAVHIRGVGPGRIVGNVLAGLKVTALVAFVALAVGFGVGDAGHLTSVAAPVAAGGWLLALIPVMFTYSGWNAASYVAEEIRDPGRNVPRALALGTAAVAALYLALNAIYLYVWPVGELAAIRGSVLDVVAERLLGGVAGNVMGVVALISLAASISAMTFAGPRVYFAMARDGAFLPAAARIHPRYRTPATAIVAQAAWSALLVMAGDATDALVNYTGFALVLFSGIAVTALFVLRAREPEAPRPFRAWGYPWVPALYVVTSAGILVNGLITAPGPTGTGLAIILAGLPLYFWFRRRA